jgi:hypothetical protein
MRPGVVGLEALDVDGRAALEAARGSQGEDIWASQGGHPEGAHPLISSLQSSAASRRSLLVQSSTWSRSPT